MAEPYGMNYTLTSGYEIVIKPLPPYYKDLVEQQFPLLEYPKRKISLLAGDEVDWPYEPPEEMPEDGTEDYDLYVQWHIVDEQRKQVESDRNVARVNYLLSMCVDVISGDFTVDDTEWVERLEAAFPNFTVPEHKGRRYLMFLKHVVIRTAEEMNMIINMCTSPEVTMQGIISALRGFQDHVEEGRHTEGS